MFRYISSIVVVICVSFAAFGAGKSSHQTVNVPQMDFALTLGEQTFDPLFDDISMQDGWNIISEGGNDLSLVQFDGPIQEAWLDEMQKTGFTPVQYIHPYTYITWSSPDNRDSAMTIPHVRWTGDFVNGYRVLPKWRNLNSTPISARVMFYKGANLERSIEQLRDAGAVRIEHKSIDHRFEVISFVAPGNSFLDISTIAGVYTVQPKPTDGGLRSEMSNQVNVGNVDAGGIAFPGYQDWIDTLGYDGDGVTIAIVDGGTDGTHPDLNGLEPCAGQSCAGGQASSHGTHVAGTVAATGASGSTDNAGFLKGQGVAPGASLVAQLYSPMYQQPGGMTLLMTESYRNGAVASSNSWGPSGSPQGYEIDTLEVDIGIRDADPDEDGNQQFSYVLAIMNGNGGTSTQGTPDEAKNIFTVGSTNMRDGSGNQIPEINDISSNSAHGPCLDGRLIPHIVAPGCQTLSTVPMSQYELMCGTSMACPQVAGGVALFVEKYREEFGIDPSPALIKAALSVSATDLSGNSDADGGTLGHPFDAKQGWGRMDLSSVMIHPEGSVRYFDAPQVLEQTGDQWTMTVSPFDSSKPMKIMLVWTDAVGHGLGGSTPAWNNDLNLVVSSGFNTYFGNNFGSQGWSSSGGLPDDKNNMEGVFLGPTPPGQVTITVIAANLNSDGIPNVGDGIDQDFSVVCYNASAEPGFSISVEPSEQSVCAPSSVDYTVHVGQIMGYDNPITLSSNPESGITATFSSNPVVPGTDVTMTVSVDDTVSDATYMFHVRGTSSDQSYHEDAVQVHVSGSLPQVSTLLLPVNNAVDVPISPTFQWYSGSGANLWHIQVSTSASETDVVYDNSSVESTTFQLPTILSPDSPYFWRIRSSNHCGLSEWTSWWTFRTTDVMTVLLVDDDDNGPDVRGVYTDMLDAFGYMYDIYDTNNSNNEPTAEELQGYPFVIWFSGSEWGGFAGPGSAGEDALASYINGGGYLILSSQDYLYDMGLTEFGSDYLGVGSYDSDVYQASVTGLDIFEDMGTVSLVPIFANWTDYVFPTPDAVTAFDGSEGETATRLDGAGHGGGAVFLGFPIEFMPEDNQHAFLQNVIDWVDGSSSEPCPSDCNGDDVVNVSDLLAIIDSWGTNSGCDVNGDGVIDVVDILLVVGSWGACP